MQKQRLLMLKCATGHDAELDHFPFHSQTSVPEMHLNVIPTGEHFPRGFLAKLCVHFLSTPIYWLQPLRSTLLRAMNVLSVFMTRSFGNWPRLTWQIVTIISLWPRGWMTCVTLKRWWPSETLIKCDLHKSPSPSLFPKCAPRIPKDLCPVLRGSVGTFL